MSDLKFQDRKFPENSDRDPQLPHNQLRPRSLRSSGLELDEACGDGSVPESGIDAAMKEYMQKEIKR